MKKHANELNVKDHQSFAEVLLQRPLEPKGVRFSTKLTDEDLAYLTRMAKERFDIVISTLQAMPRNMIFVVRNLNTIRAIAHEHGDPVDRPKLMARYALHCIEENRRGIFGFFSWLRECFIFEYKLWVSSTKYNILKTYLNLLNKLGRSPDAKKLLHVGVEKL